MDERKVKKNPLKESLTCVLCGLLFIEATAITECLHIFCRKCIYKKLEDEEENCCPVCKVGLGTTPLEKLRPDHTFQNLRDKIFPRKSSDLVSPSNITNVGRKKGSSSRNHGKSAQTAVESTNVQHGSGTGQVCFILVASQDMEGNSLPQVSSGSLRFKDGHLPVPYIQKYLKKKLKLERETEVEIMCNGQPISSTLPISDLLNQWQQTRAPSDPAQVQHPDAHNIAVVSEKENANQCLAHLNFQGTPQLIENPTSTEPERDCKNCTMVQIGSVDRYFPYDVEINIKEQVYGFCL